MGHKDLRLGQIVYILVFYNIHFLGFFHWTVSNLIFCCVTVKTIYSFLVLFMSCQTWTSVTVQLQGINVNTFVSTLWVAMRAHANLDTSYKWTGSLAKVNHMYN